MKIHEIEKIFLTVLLLLMLIFSSFCPIAITNLTNDTVSLDKTSYEYSLMQDASSSPANSYSINQIEPIGPFQPPIAYVPENWYSSKFDFIKYLGDNPNDYHEIWEPWLSKAAIHAIAASEDGEFLAIGGGYLYDNEVHIFRWNPETLEYDRVWDSGDNIIKRDILSLAWGDTDNNSFMEVIVGSADGHVYVFEQRHIYDPLTNTENQFEHVWTSPLMRPVFSVEIADTDRDRIPDILVGAWDGLHIFEYTNHSGYPFSKVHSIEYTEVWKSTGISDNMICSVTSGDVNSNGLPDIIAGTRNGTIYIFENDGVVLNVNGKPFPLVSDNKYRLNATLQGYIWKPITSLDIGNLDDDSDDEIVAMALTQGVYVVDRRINNNFSIEKLVRPLESWEETVSPNSLDYFVDTAKSATNVYYNTLTEPMANPPNPISPWNTAMARIDGETSRFIPGQAGKATALLDFGRDEEITGNGNDSPDIELTFLIYPGFASIPNFTNLKFYVSPNNFLFREINDKDLNWEAIPSGFTVKINLDDVLFNNRWDYVQYLNITVYGSESYAIDGILVNTLYRPIDAATFTGIFPIELNSSNVIQEFNARLEAHLSGKEYSATSKAKPNKILIGTTDGRLIIFAYSSTSANYSELWDSYLGRTPLASKPNLFNLKTNIWAIQNVETIGKIPTWLTTENFTYIKDFPLFYNVNLTDFEYASITFTDVYAYDYLPDLIVGTKGTDSRPGTIECLSNPQTAAKFSYLNYWYGLPWLYNNTKLWLSTAFGDINLTRPTYVNYDPLELIVGYFEPGNGSGNPIDGGSTCRQAGLDYWEVVSSTGEWTHRIPLTQLEVTGELQTILNRSVTLPKAALADMDGDLDLDLTITNGRIYYLENIGTLANPLFAVKKEYYREINMRGSQFSSPQLVDFDMDGDFDLVVSFVDKYGTTYFENTGTDKNPIWVERKKFFSNPERNFKLYNFTDPVFYHASQLYYLIENATFPIDAFSETYHETFGTTWVMSAYNNETKQIVTFFGDVNSHSRLIIGTNPRIVRLEVALADGPLWNLGYHVFETWNNDNELDEWTLTVEIGDVDRDGKNEVIVGDFDNNLYVFEHLANNTYKRAFRTFDFNHTVESDSSPYAWQELEGLSGNFSRKIWDHVENLVVNSDLDNDALKEIIATADLSIYVFEQKISIAGIPIDDEFSLVWSEDLRKSKWGQSLQENGLEKINALAYCNDLDYNGLGEIIVAVGDYLFVFESRQDNAFAEVFFSDAPLGRYFLPGNPEVSLGNSGYTGLFINTVATGDTDSDGYMEIIVGGVRNITEMEPARHGFVFILENHIGTYQLSWEAPDELTYLNPVNVIAIDDQDYDGQKELIVGHEHGIDVWEWNRTSNEYAKMEVITSSPNYPIIDLGSLRLLRSTTFQLAGRNSDIFQMENGTLIQIYSEVVGGNETRLFFMTSNDEGLTWSLPKRLTNDTEYGTQTVLWEIQPSITEVNGETCFAWLTLGTSSGGTPFWAIFFRYYSTTGWSPLEAPLGYDYGQFFSYSPSLYQVELPSPYSGYTVAISYLYSGDGKVHNLARLPGTGWGVIGVVEPLPYIGSEAMFRYEASSIDMIALKDGRYALAFAGRFKNETKNDYDIWVMTTNAAGGWDLPPVRLTSKSTDEGNPSIAQLKSEDGTVIVIFESFGGLREETIQLCYSKDGGRTWSTPETMPSLPPYTMEYVLNGVTYYKLIYDEIPVYTPQSFAPRIAARNGGGFIYSVLAYAPVRLPLIEDIYDILVGVNPSSKWALNDMESVHIIGVGDTDSDGRREIAADYKNKVILFELAHSNSSYQQHVQVWTSPELPETVTDICIGDANGNGWEEVIISAKKGNVYSYEITQTSLPNVNMLISEITGWIFPYSESPIVSEGLKTGNFDYDLEPELVAARHENVTVFEANGSILWEYSVVNQSIKNLAIGDINGDGVDDVIFGAISTFGILINGTVFAINGIDGTQLWNLTCIIAIPPRSVTFGDIALGDLDGDGVKDIVIETSVFYYMGFPPSLVEIPGICAINGSGAGLLWSKTLSESIVGLTVGNLHVGDHMDVVISTVDNVQAFNGTDGNQLWMFSPSNKAYDTPLSKTALCDLDQDGLDDVIVSGTIYVWPSHKGVIFALNGLNGIQIWNSTQLEGSYKLYAENAMVTDLNNDSTADIILSFNDFYMQNSHILGVDGSNGETLWIYRVNNDMASYLTVGDFNNDGTFEVASIHHDLTSNNETMVVLNSKGMTYSGFYSEWITSFSGIAAEDFDQDGAFEVALATSNGQVYIVQEAPLGWNPPSSPVRILEPSWSSIAYESDITLMASGDINGDGIDDIISADYEGKISAFSGIDGEKLWNTSLPSTPILLTTGHIEPSGPFDVFIYGIDELGYNLFALNGDNGNQLWKTALPRRYIYVPQPGYYLWERLNVVSLEVAELDGDAEDELVIAGSSVLTSVEGFIFAVDDNGSLLWQQYPSFPVSNIEITDIIGIAGLGFDGIEDIIAITFDLFTNKNYVDIVNGADGTVTTHVQITSFFNPIVTSELGFLNNDEYPEIVASTSGEYSYCFAIDLPGSIMNGTYAKLLWSRWVPHIKSIVISNFDFYPGNDVAVLAWMSEIIVLNGADGEISWRFNNPTIYPIPFSPHPEIFQSKMYAPFLAGDINGDGIDEIIVLNWAKIYAISQNRLSYFIYKSTIAWSTHDLSEGITAYTTGNFDGDTSPDIAVGTLDGHIYTMFDFVEAVNYQLQISTTTGGTTSPAPGTYTYPENTQITVTAIPETGYQFDYWLINGTLTNTDNPITITMEANYHLTAYFRTIQTYSLTIETTSGGTTSPPPGIYTYPEGTEVSIQAIPDTGYIFDHWTLSNGTNSTANPITFVINADYTITAYFTTATGVIPHDDLYINEDTVLAPGFYNLNDNYAPEGIIIINASNIVLDCNYAVLNGSGWGIAIVNHGFDNVTIKNAVIQNFDYGILFYNFTENNTIINNKITQCNHEGIWFSDYYGAPTSSNITLAQNEISLCDVGIKISTASDITITLNNVTSCRLGVVAADSYSLVIANNAFAYNEYGLQLGTGITSVVSNSTIMYNFIHSNSWRGLYLPYAINNTIAKNVVENNTLTGIYLSWNVSYNKIADNTVVDNGETGIHIRYGSFNRIVNNVILRNGQCGINMSDIIGTITGTLYPSLNNTIAHNTISYNVYGVAVKGGANYNIVVNNTITKNSYGIFLSKDRYSGYVYTPIGNRIYHNNFINNTILQAYDEGANIFDNGYPSGGNYWSNYTGSDLNGDGIGDTPYIIDADSQDNYPIINPNSWEPFNTLGATRKLEVFNNSNEPSPLLAYLPIVFSSLLYAHLASVKIRKKKRKTKSPKFFSKKHD